MQRPTISEVLKEIQEAILIEKRIHPDTEYPLGSISKKSMCSSVNMDAADLALSDNASFDDLLLRPGLR